MNFLPVCIIARYSSDNLIAGYRALTGSQTKQGSIGPNGREHGL